MTRKSAGLALILSMALGIVHGCKRSPEGNMVDLALLNGKIWTGDPGRPWAEAVAVRGDKIFAVGTTADVRKLASGAANLVDLGGALVLPGFIDSHTHFLAGGFALKSIQLRAARSWMLFRAKPPSRK